MEENGLDESLLLEEDKDSFMQPPTRTLRNFTLVNNSQLLPKILNFRQITYFYP